MNDKLEGFLMGCAFVGVLWSMGWISQQLDRIDGFRRRNERD